MNRGTHGPAYGFNGRLAERGRAFGLSLAASKTAAAARLKLGSPGLTVANSFSGAQTITNATASTSISTGALTVTGGVGIAGALHAGSTIKSIGAVVIGYAGTTGVVYFGSGDNYLYFDDVSFTFGGGKHVLIGTSIASTSTTTGALVVQGGVGIAGKIYIGSDASVAGTLNVIGGAVVGSGGSTGVLYFGNTAGKYLVFDGTYFNLIGAALGITSNAQSTNTTTGALVLTSGGLGVSGRMSIGGAIYSYSPPATVPAINLTNNLTTAIASGSNFTFYTASGAYLILVYNYNTGGGGFYLATAATLFFLGSAGNGSEFVASTTTPAAGKSSIAYNGTNYALYNNTGVTSTYSLGIMIA